VDKFKLTFYDGFFWYHTALKMLAIAMAMPVLFALSDTKIISSKK